LCWLKIDKATIQERLTGKYDEDVDQVTAYTGLRIKKAKFILIKKGLYKGPQSGECPASSRFILAKHRHSKKMFSEVA